jgi:hypothetical protein
MLSPNGPCFVSVPNAKNQRILHAAKVIELVGREGAVVRLEEELAFEPGADVTVYAELRGKFHQQPAKVTGLRTPATGTANTENTKPGNAKPAAKTPANSKNAPQPAADDNTPAATLNGPAVELVLVGQPVNCEARGTYRVGVASQDIRLAAGKQVNCLLTDISAEGLSVITPQPLQVGTSIDVNLSVDGIYAFGPVRVQTEKKLPSGQLRYGLYAPEKKSQLRKSLETLSALLQRRQLRRMSRAA